MIINTQLIKHVCFDLDGTLIDSYNTIYKTTLKTLEHLNIDGKFDEREFYKRIGHHFLDIFKELNISVTDIEHYINVYKSFYFNYIDESVLYPGVTELLDFLTSNNFKVSLLTTKGQDQAEKIISHFNLDKYFSCIMGRRIGMEIKPSPIPLIFICKEIMVSPSETLMVGDSELDIRCAKAAAAASCAVTFGYRSLETLQDEQPDFIMSDLKSIISIFDTN